MGQTMSFPATHKQTSSGGNARLLYAVTAMQGWRITMEDAHAAVLSLDEGTENSNSFFAVYDGHSGKSVAQFASSNVHKRLVTEEAYREKRFEEAFKRAFLGIDQEMSTNREYSSGCTAVAALVTSDNRIFVANAGDSRSVLSVKGEAKPLSFDHKPSNQTEKSRIIEAGGYLDEGRVNGCLALTRSLGDFRFKKNTSLGPEKQIITADPDVTIHDITEEDEFFVVACDGIWDCLSSQQVINIIRLKISEGKELSEICEMLCDHCLAPDTNIANGMGCDNMSILIVAILNGRTKEQWYDWVTERVQDGYGHQTPADLPQIYSSNRLAVFKAHQERRKQRELREQQERLRTEQEALEASKVSANTELLSGTETLESADGEDSVKVDDRS